MIPVVFCMMIHSKLWTALPLTLLLAAVANYTFIPMVRYKMKEVRRIAQAMIWPPYIEPAMAFCVIGEDEHGPCTFHGAAGDLLSRAGDFADKGIKSFAPMMVN